MVGKYAENKRLLTRELCEVISGEKHVKIIEFLIKYKG